MTDKLEDGFYWVLYCGHWTTAIHTNHWWFVPGGVSALDHSDFDEIDPRPIKRDNGSNN